MPNLTTAINFPSQRLSFSQTLPFHQIAWDSTSSSALKLCPRMYYYSIMYGLVTREENIHFRFGIEIHAGLEYYDRLKAKGISHQDAFQETILELFYRTWDEKKGRPWLSDDSGKNRGTLIRAIAWYLHHFADDPLETIILPDGNPAVELSYRFNSGIFSRLTGEEYILCGHLDRMATFNETKSYIIDRKTTKFAINEDFFAKFAPDNQMSGYYTAGKIAFKQQISGIIIDAIQTGATFTRFQRGFTYRTQSQLEEWLDDIEIYFRHNEQYVEANYWPQNDKACGLYGGCPYRPICGSGPEVRDRLLKTTFQRRIWDPLETREP